MISRYRETAEASAHAWALANLARGGYSPRQWADRIIDGLNVIDQVHEVYQPAIKGYLAIKAMREHATD